MFSSVRAIRNVASSISGFFAMPNPWDRPPKATSANADQNDIFRAVGQALSAWESVEHYIARIFAVLVAEKISGPPYATSADGSSPAARAYGSVISFQGRATMVEAAANAFFYTHPHPEFPGRLRKLMKTAVGWTARRNDVAHGIVYGCPWDGSKSLLWPNDYSTSKRSIDRQVAYWYNDEQIIEFGKAFDRLGTEFSKFHSELWVWRLEQPG